MTQLNKGFRPGRPISAEDERLRDSVLLWSQLKLKEKQKDEEHLPRNLKKKKKLFSAAAFISREMRKVKSKVILSFYKPSNELDAKLLSKASELRGS